MTETEPCLFDVEQPIPALDEAPGMSVDRARTIRQRRAIANGQHPLGLVYPGVNVHLEVLVGGANYTCGDCIYRETIGHRSRSYPKCLYGGVEVTKAGYQGAPYTTTVYPRVSHGAATDCRASWPGCGQFEAKA